MWIFLKIMLDDVWTEGYTFSIFLVNPMGVDRL